VVNRFWRAVARILACTAVVDAIIAYAKRRPYSHLYGYMGRWWVMPRWLLGRDEFGSLFPRNWLPFAIRLHHILRYDADLDLHDHPRTFRTIILRGWYWEEDVFGKTRYFAAGDTAHRPFHTFHRITQVSPGGVWTLFIMGRKRHEWGFLTGDPPRKVHWRKYISKNQRGHMVSGDEAYIP
jgi:hypothetical protein